MKVTRMTGKGYKLLESALKSLKGVSAKVGWVQRKQYPDSEMTTAEAAALSEFGSPAKNIPPRATGRPVARKRKNIWSKIAETESKKVLTGKQTGEGVMEIVGLQAAGDWREEIINLYDPPLSPKTIAARLRKHADKKTIGNLTKPLEDTKVMLNSLTNTVERE